MSNGFVTNEKEIEGGSLYELVEQLKASAKLLSPAEMRYLVDAYYTQQSARKELYSVRKPNAVVSNVQEEFAKIERSIKSALDIATLTHHAGRWSRSVAGVGPVLAAGLLAYIDISRVSDEIQLWKVCGLDPTEAFVSNHKLKAICLRLGESFYKVSRHPNDYYGKIYQRRKALETIKNERGDYADQAKAKLVKKLSEEERSIYASGKLPTAHIHERAKRYAAKIFLSHWWAVSWEVLHGEQDAPAYGTAPRPMIITEGGHKDYVPPPNWPMIEDKMTEILVEGEGGNLKHFGIGALNEQETQLQLGENGKRGPMLDMRQTQKDKVRVCPMCNGPLENSLGLIYCKNDSEHYRISEVTDDEF
jgi:hypothetical protein